MRRKEKPELTREAVIDLLQKHPEGMVGADLRKHFRRPASEIYKAMGDPFGHGIGFRDWTFTIVRERIHGTPRSRYFLTEEWDRKHHEPVQLSLDLRENSVNYAQPVKGRLHDSDRN